MAAIPAWVVAFVGQQSAQRGYSYFREGKVELHNVSMHNGIKPGEPSTVVRGIVHGTSPTPYQAWASISADNITDAHCSCPVGTGGKCKHVAALVLAAKSGPEHSHKTQLVTVPTASSSPSAPSAPRQLWNGPFTSALSQQSSPSTQFRAQISPKKNVWGSPLSNTTSTVIPFSVQPGFSLKENANLCAHRDPFEPAPSQPSSPFKPKHSSQHEHRVSLYPIPLSQSDTQANSSQPHDTHIPSSGAYTNSTTETTESPANSTAPIPHTPAPTSAETASIAALQEEIRQSVQYQKNLRQQCDLLRDQVQYLESQLARRDAEIAQLKSQQATNSNTKTPPHVMEVDIKTEKNESSKNGNHAFHPQHVHPPQPKPSEETRDSIEETLSEDGVVKGSNNTTNSKTKKRTREYDAEDKPGLIKRLSFETTSTEVHHYGQAQSVPHNKTANPSPAQDIPRGPPPQILSYDIDSQTLMDAMDQFEADAVGGRGRHSMDTSTGLDTTVSTSTTSQNVSTHLPRTSAPGSPTSSQISTSNSETNGSKPASPGPAAVNPPSHTIGSLQTQPPDHMSAASTASK